jgi:hypothetical protein
MLPRRSLGEGGLNRSRLSRKLFRGWASVREGDAIQIQSLGTRNGNEERFTLTSRHGRGGTPLRTSFRNTAGAGAHEERLTKGAIATLN